MFSLSSDIYGTEKDLLTEVAFLQWKQWMSMITICRERQDYLYSNTTVMDMSTFCTDKSAADTERHMIKSWGWSACVRSGREVISFPTDCLVHIDQFIMDEQCSCTSEKANVAQMLWLLGSNQQSRIRLGGTAQNLNRLLICIMSWQWFCKPSAARRLPIN